MDGRISLDKSLAGSITQGELKSLRQGDTLKQCWICSPFLLVVKDDTKIKPVDNVDSLISRMNSALSYDPHRVGEQLDGHYYDVPIESVYINVNNVTYEVAAAAPSYMKELTPDMVEDVKNLISLASRPAFNPDEFFKDYPAVVGMATAKACTSVEEAEALLKRLGLSE